MSDIYELALEYKAALLKRERAAAVRLVKAYGLSYDRLRKQLDLLIEQMKLARKRGEPIDPNWLFRQERYFALLNDVVREMAKFADVAGSTITGEQRAAVKAALNDSQRLLLASAEASTITAAFNRVPVVAVENLVGFLSDGSPLSTLLGQFGSIGRQQVESALIQGVALGHGPRKIASGMKKALGGNLARALTISRTETARAYNEASHQTYQQNADVLQGWQWLAALNSRTCAACIALHGSVHPVTERMATHVNCRCTQVPVLIGEELPLTRGAKWFQSQSATVQRDVLGSEAAYQAFKSKKLSLEDFVGRKDNPRWGASFYQLSVKRALNKEARFPQ